MMEEYYDVSDLLARCATALAARSSSCPSASTSDAGAGAAPRGDSSGGVAGAAASSMLHAPEFSLFESMSAVEIMDQRMDAGAGGKRLPTASEMIRAGRAPLGLSAARLCAVMDRMVCCELAWFRGATLAQTVLTCLYLADGGVDRDADEFAYAAVEGYRATCARVLEFVQEARVFEEEDFVEMRFGGGLYDGSPAGPGGRQGVTLGGGAAAAAGAAEGPVDEQLEAAIARLERVRGGLRASTAAALGGGDGADAAARTEELLALPVVRELMKERAAGGDGAAEDCLPCIDALLHRMRLRRSTYGVFRLISTSSSSPPGTRLPLDRIRRGLESALSALGAVYETRALSSGDCVGFDEDVSRRMLGPSVVRSATIPPVDDALLGLRSMLGSMLRACDASSCSSLRELHEFMHDFCAEDVGALPRSLAWLIVTRHESGLLDRLAFDALVVPPASAADAPAFREFIMDHAHSRVSLLVRAACSNPGRQRRMIRQGFHLWAEMFTVANNLDTHADAGPAVRASGGFEGTWWGEHFALAWVQDTVTKQLIAFLLHGFPLELYCANEYAMIYWYLQFLIGRLLDGMGLMRSSAATVADAPRGGRARGHRRDGILETLRVLDVDILVWKAKRLLCQGAVRLLHGIAKAGELSASPAAYTLEDEFNTEAERYRQRFECFRALPYPPAVGHEEYLRSTGSDGHSAEDVLKLAAPCYMQASAILTQLRGILPPGAAAAPVGREESPSTKLLRRRREEVLEMQRVAMTNSVASNVLLSRCGSPDCATKVSFEFESSRHFFTVSCKT